MVSKKYKARADIIDSSVAMYVRAPHSPLDNPVSVEPLPDSSNGGTQGFDASL